MAIKVKQHDYTDCGAACIASVAGHYKLVLPIARIRQLASTGKKGTTIAGILEAFRALGFDAKAGRGDLSTLMNISKPAIAHLVTPARLHHYVVIYGADGNLIELMDPADGRIHHYSHEEFLQQWTGVIVVALPAESFSSGDRTTSVWLRLWQLARVYKAVLLQALVGSVVFTMIGLSTSIFVQKIVDHVLPDGNRNLLNLMGILMLGLLVVQSFIAVCRSKMVLKTGQRLDAKLILGYYSHLLRLPQTFFDRMRVGEITSRVGDAMKIREFVNDAAVNVAVNLLIVLLSFALMFTHHWRLALAMISALPVYTLLYWLANRLNRRVERSLMERAADLEAQLVESLHGIQTLKCFCMEHYADRKAESRFVSLLQSVYASGSNTIALGQAGEFVSKLFTIAVLWMGAGFALDHEITPGELLSFFALIEYFSGPATSLISLNKTVQNALIAADRLFDIMDLEPEQVGEKVVLTPALVGDIVFSKVLFRYDAAITVFNNLDLVIRKHQVTAIVGESGCGKSTVLSVLQRVYATDGGSVKIGSCDLRYVDLTSLRTIISVVPQRVDLFAGTVIDNIAVGIPSPNIARIISICESLNILPFIERLPQGLYTWLGEQGVSLSGGQKQRIAIARALYRDPEILALDEATSALDAGAEQYVQRMIEIMRRGQKTVIIVAHRLSSIMRADKIVVLGNGAVQEEGTHQHLMDKKGTYYELWRQQNHPVELAEELVARLSF